MGFNFVTCLEEAGLPPSETRDTEISFRRRGILMILLTRLNGKTFYLNALLIENIESFPDTTILLTNGKRYVVSEDAETVVKNVKDFYRDIQVLPFDRPNKGGDSFEEDH